MQPLFRRACLPAAIAAALGTLCSTAPAQDSQTTLKEVTVSSGTDKPVQERTELGKINEYTPISGASLGREEVEHLQLVNNLLELGKRVPGISMVRNMRIPDGGKLYTENRIDGMRATGTNTSLLDEVDLADIDRIDVITGPASALYGSGAFGGTISVYTRQPPREFGGRLSQEIGSFGLRRTQFNVGHTFGEGRFGFLVTGSTMDNDGWRKSSAPGGQDAAAEHKDGLTFRGVFRPTDTTKITFGHSHLKYDFRWAGPLRVSLFNQNWQQTERGTYGQYIDTYRTTSFRLQQAVAERGELTIARTRVADDQINNGNGGSGGANNIICDNVTVGCAVSNNGSATVTNTIKQANSTIVTTLAMYRHDFDLAKTTAYLGAEWVDQASDSSTFNNAFNALQAQSGSWIKRNISNAGNLTGQKERTPFLHVEFSPLDPLRIHVGARFGRIDYRVDDRTATNRDLTMTRTGNVRRLGATWEFNKNHLMWANWGETFNPQALGTIVNSAAVGTAGNVIGQVLNPERGLTREIGFRGKSPDLGLRYDATLFHAVSKGFTIARTCTAAERLAFNNNVACTINDTAGIVASRGLESMVTWSPAKWLDIGATYTNSLVYFAESRTTAANDISGKDYQAAPRHKLNVRLGFKPAAGWLVELEHDHISRYYTDQTVAQGNTYSRPDLLTLRASYRSKDWTFWLHAFNLTNKQYATRMQQSTIAGVANVLATQAGHGNAGSYTPLNIRLGAAYTF